MGGSVCMEYHLHGLLLRAFLLDTSDCVQPPMSLTPYVLSKVQTTFLWSATLHTGQSDDIKISTSLGVKAMNDGSQLYESNDQAHWARRLVADPLAEWAAQSVIVPRFTQIRFSATSTIKARRRLKVSVLGILGFAAWETWTCNLAQEGSLRTWFSSSKLVSLRHNQFLTLLVQVNGSVLFFPVTPGCSLQC